MKKSSQSGSGILWIIILMVVIIASVIIFKKDTSVEQNVEPTSVEQTEEKTSSSRTVTISNVNSSQPLSPGVYILHTSAVSINFNGELIPESMESLVEIGDTKKFATFAKMLPGVKEVIVIDSPILPAEKTSFDFISEDETLLISGIQMAAASNDGYILFDSVPVTETELVIAGNYDGGTEVNTEIGSGFDGGQPDPARGVENIENGTASDPQEPTRFHEQLRQPIATLVIE